ncbi:MAG: DnaJ domain-containing protein [Acidobacteria bacterium]|nr:DnaJ domain-containing protein [Acidobacteriota bacterium]
MHDFFEVLGIPDSARASEVRRAYARRVRRSHPDFCLAGMPPDAQALSSTPASPPAREVAVDFVDASTFVGRMQAAFFSRLN